MNKDLEIFYNDLDKIVYSTKEPPMKIESKLSKIDEKLHEYNKINENIITTKLNRKKVTSTNDNNEENSDDDEYRRYNVFIPKLKINNTSKKITTFVNDKYEDQKYRDDKTEEFESKDNELIFADFVSKIVEKTHTNNPTINFYHNKFFEYNYSDVGETE